MAGPRPVFLKFVENGTSTGTALVNLNWFSLVLPTAPAGLAAIPTTSTQTNFTWTASAGATGYDLLRSTTAGGPYTAVASGLTATTFGNTGLTPGISYFYVIRANYAAVASADSAEIRTVPSHPIDPKDVTLSAAPITSNGAGGKKITLTIAKSGLGHFHQAQSTVNPSMGPWINTGPVLMGSGGPLQTDVPLTSGVPRSFYRIRVWRE